MDLGTLLNRLYLDFYSSPKQFWIDMGFIWKNCRKYNAKSTDQDIRVLCDTLRELAIEYYKIWHSWTK